MNWKSIIATALISGLVTVMTGMLLFWFQNKEPKLIYSTIQSIPFAGDAEKVFIFQTNVRNTGRRVVDDVVLSVNLADGKILNSTIEANPIIQYKAQDTPQSYRIEAPNLNPDEGLSLSLLISSIGTVSSSPEISLRGKGIVGKPSQNEQPFPKILFIGILAAYVGIISTFIIYVRYFREQIFGKFISREQKHVLASALSLFGFPEETKDYLKSPAKHEYWIEAESITAQSIMTKDKVHLTKTRHLLEYLSKQKFIVKTSKAVILYSLARINYITTGASSKRELGNAHLKRVSIGMKGMEQVEQNVEHGRGESQPGAEVIASAVFKLFEVTHVGEHRESCFDTHTLVPSTFGTELHVLGCTLLVTKAVVCQDNCLSCEGYDQRVKGFVWNIHGVEGPSDDFARFIDEPAELNPDAPSPFVSALLT